MAFANPITVTDPMGAETYTFWTDGTAVKFTTNLRPVPITAFSQPVANSAIAVYFGTDGCIYVTYYDAGGNKLTQYSPRDGDAGSWAVWPPPPPPPP